jgi:outer membrane lipoprotein-sorting protein
MIKKAFLTLSILLFGLQLSQAQTAEKVLNDLLTSAKTSAIRTNFKLSTTIKADPQPHTTTGTFTLKGNKFVLDMPQMKVWFNGKTQWAYSSQTNEVSITEPSEKEIGETNPMAIIGSFKDQSNIKFSPKGNSGSNHLIEMSSKNKKLQISKIEVAINKASGNLVSIKSFYVNGSTSILLLNNFEKGVNVPETVFNFNQAKYKGISINDLR